MTRGTRRSVFVVLIFFPVLAGTTVSPEADSERVGAVVEAAMGRGLIAGGVVCAGNHDGILLARCYGALSSAQGAPPLGLDAVFDIASLTKVVATAPVVMKFVERGLLRLDDPIGKWFGQFKGRGIGSVTIDQLLTHSSGLRDVPFGDREPVIEEALAKLAVQRPKGVPGSAFQYADINFILLAEVVRRASSRSIDAWAQEDFFGPLGMGDSGYVPTADIRSRCVPTSDGCGGLLVGRVQDLTARQLGGVTGHAGVFSTASDLSRFCRMILNHGELDGRRVLTRESLSSMLSRRCYEGGAVVRGLGWDFVSPYSSPRGSRMTGESFGHTGYSGGSLWIDPVQDLFVVVLTARLDYRRTREFNQFRADVSDAVADRWAVR